MPCPRNYPSRLTMPKPAKPFRSYIERDHEANTLRIVIADGPLSAEAAPGNHLITILRTPDGKIAGLEAWEIDRVLRKNDRP